MTINPNGTGQVLIFPYYAAQVYGRNGFLLNECGFSRCPPSPPFVSYQTKVISFASSFSCAAWCHREFRALMPRPS